MSTFDRQAILDCLSKIVTPGIKLTALADELGIRKHEYAELRAEIFDLVEDGTIIVLTGGAFALAPMGRPADPLAKPVPPPPPATATQRMRPLKKSAPPPKKVVAPKKPAVAPWRPPAGIKPVPATEEYDPETGEVRAIAASPTPSVAAGTPAKGVPAAPPATTDPRYTGRITVHPAGYGFVNTDEGETVFVPAKYRNHSLDGDRVVVDTWPGVRGTEGKVKQVIARGRARLTGILRRVGRAVYLEPDDPRIAADYGRVHMDDAPMGKDGDAIVVEITRYPDAVRREMAAKLLKVLGDPDDPRTEIEKILAVSMIPLEFPDEAAEQATRTPSELGPTDFADRIDLRSRRFATIDPETARDFDDALCIEAGPHGGPRVWVAVADVSHYVRWNDALDREAAIRGVSVYLPDRVIPMLPHQLSSNICSLLPNVDRCAMVVRLDYSPEGDVLDTGYSAAVIRSKARLDYPGVAAALEGDFRGRREQYREWSGELEKLNALAKVLRARRMARGSLDLEIAEPKVVLDADDPRLVRDVVKAKGDPAVKGAYQLVEEFMIAANEAVGHFFRKRDATTVWRVHAPPDKDRVAHLAELLGAYGIEVDVDRATTPRGMKDVLDQIAQKPGAQALSFLLLRTLTQAVWDTVPIGHFGLASGDYLHFTSPIRRYPDLLVHRLLKYHLHKDGSASGGGYAKPPPPIETLAELAAASSAHERRAMEAEREAVAMYRTFLMRDQVGEQFPGTVSAVTSFGAFVELDEPFVEGLIKLESLGEHFDYDEVHMRLSAQRSGRAIELGDKVTVEIANVSVIRRRIDFTLIQGQKHEPRPATLQTNPRTSLQKKKKAGREVERAQTHQVERGAKPRTNSGGGKPKLGVSHRGFSGSGGGKKKKR
ncbi:MAG: ribonuclease R [Kofleriaceae bacterium]